MADNSSVGSPGLISSGSPPHAVASTPMDNMMKQQMNLITDFLLNVKVTKTFPIFHHEKRDCNIWLQKERQPIIKIC